MRVIGLIPARWGSTRFPGKSLAPILGRPLIAWVIDAAREARLLDRVVLATDDSRIAEAAVRWGADVVMTRADHASGTDRVAEAAQPSDADIVVNIQGDEPLVPPAVIDGLVEAMQATGDADMATVVCPLTDARDLNAASVVKVVADGRDRALYFSRLPIPACRDGKPRLVGGDYLRHIGLYAYRGGFLKRLVREPPCRLEQLESLEQLRALHLGGHIQLVRAAFDGTGVDNPEDVARVEALLRERMTCHAER